MALFIAIDFFQSAESLNVQYNSWAFCNFNVKRFVSPVSLYALSERPFQNIFDLECSSARHHNLHLVEKLMSCLCISQAIWNCVRSRTFFQLYFSIRPCCSLNMVMFLNVLVILSIFSNPNNARLITLVSFYGRLHGSTSIYGILTKKRTPWIRFERDKCSGWELEEARHL